MPLIRNLQTLVLNKELQFGLLIKKMQKTSLKMEASSSKTFTIENKTCKRMSRICIFIYP